MYQTRQNVFTSYQDEKRRGMHQAHLFYMDALRLGHYGNLRSISEKYEKAYTELMASHDLAQRINRAELNNLSLE